MGTSNSKTQMKKSSSSSAAFGRLRIDSPDVASPARRRLKQRRQQVGADNASSMASMGAGSPIIGRDGILRQSSSMNEFQKVIPGEKSPLLLPQNYHHQQQRQLGSHGHGGSPGSEDYGFLTNASPGSSPVINQDTIKALTPQEAVGSPPLIIWIGPALFCALCYALYNIFIKKGSYSINPVLGGVILQLVAAILGTALLTFLIYTQGKEDIVVYDQEGINWAILAGLAVGAAEITSFFVSSLGVQATQSIPIIIGGSVMFGCIIGAVALHEVLTYRGWFGVILISIGISLVGLDDSGEGGA